MENFKENIAIIVVVVISIASIVSSSYRTSVREHAQIVEIEENRSEIEETSGNLKKDLEDIHKSLDEIEKNLDLIKKEVEKRQNQKLRARTCYQILQIKEMIFYFLIVIVAQKPTEICSLEINVKIKL